MKEASEATPSTLKNFGRGTKIRWFQRTRKISNGRGKVIRPLMDHLAPLFELVAGRWQLANKCEFVSKLRKGWGVWKEARV
jgi:hypothetical protein